MPTTGQYEPLVQSEHVAVLGENKYCPMGHATHADTDVERATDVSPAPQAIRAVAFGQ